MCSNPSGGIHRMARTAWQKETVQRTWTTDAVLVWMTEQLSKRVEAGCAVDVGSGTVHDVLVWLWVQTTQPKVCRVPRWKKNYQHMGSESCMQGTSS